VVLTIDPQGAVAMKKIYPDGIYIFVVPPSWESLAKRLKKRATDDDASTEVRLKNAKKELTYLSHYDYIVVNDLLEDAVDDVAAIIRAEHCRRVRLTSDQVPFLK
jgi:guanylate kinase